MKIDHNFTTHRDTMIERPDGSQIPFGKLDADKQIEHDAVKSLCARADAISESLLEFKLTALAEMVGARVMMLEDHGVKRGGKEGNLTLRSACGTLAVKMTVSKHITFGKELEAAQALIGQFLEAELDKGASTVIRDIFEKVFELNGEGRIDTAGILGLRQHRFDDPSWTEAMVLINKAISHDSVTTYVNFYHVDPNEEKRGDRETRIVLDLAGV